MALAWLIQESPLGSSEQVRSDLKLQRSQRASQRAFSLRILSLTNSIGFESREHAQGIPTVETVHCTEEFLRAQTFVYAVPFV